MIIGKKEKKQTEQNITKKTDLLTFGKFKGKSIQFILMEQPSYICWLYENDIVSISDDIVIEAESEGSGIVEDWLGDYGDFGNQD
jgi:hypothetical protein